MVSFNVIGLATAVALLASPAIAAPAPQALGCRAITKTSGAGSSCPVPAKSCGFGQRPGRELSREGWSDGRICSVTITYECCTRP
ncbi:hypothetical protein G6011_09844 [Alternaria panax]|uniref:Uncharacterized protein n=1 Tax=Alternaria panax TaxID=48097 RepID=A0AAD4FCS2_9PLEO|nr:hypothetical protein G6011_09844 [Alternaria panax]